MSTSKNFDTFKKYNVKNFALLKMRKTTFNNAYRGTPVLEIENTMSAESKLEILNQFTDGAASQAYAMLTTLETMAPQLKPNPDGFSYNLNSVRGLIKKIDKEGYFKESASRRTRLSLIFHIDPSVGGLGEYLNKLEQRLRFEIDVTPYATRAHGGNGFTIVGQGEYGNRLAFTDYDVIHSWFNQLLKSLYHAEKKAYESVDSLEILVTQVKESGRTYGVFDHKRLNDIVYGARPADVTTDELMAYIECYAHMSKIIQQCTTKLLTDTRIPLQRDV